MESFFQLFQVFSGDRCIAGNDVINDAGTFEKLCDDNWSIQVVIHGFVAFGTQLFYIDTF